MMAKYTALNIADWLVNWANVNEAEVTNMKLQKLLYFVQGHYMDLHNGTPLFDEDMEAWAHGPVIPEIYRVFKKFGSGAVEVFERDFDWATYDDEINDYLTTIWNTYGEMAAWKLRNISHAQDPWMNNFKDGEYACSIPKADISKYFTGRTHVVSK